MPCYGCMLHAQGRHNAGEVAKELTRKQLTDVCSALDQQVSAAVAAVQQAQEEQEQGQEQDTDVIRELVRTWVRGPAAGKQLLQGCPPP